MPHLAELLVQEDLKLGKKNWEVRARQVIVESAELGELMHPEAGDEVVVEAEDSD